MLTEALSRAHLEPLNSFAVTRAVLRRCLSSPELDDPIPDTDLRMQERRKLGSLKICRSSIREHLSLFRGASGERELFLFGACVAKSLSQLD